jgi:hypothetical protein
MKIARTLAAGSLSILMLLAGCSHEQPQAHRPLSPFTAAKAITDQALQQNVEYPYTAHLASVGNETALRTLMRLRGLDDLAAAQHGAVLTYLVDVWGDKPFTAVLMDEQDDTQQYVALLIRDEIWRDYSQQLADRQAAAQAKAAAAEETARAPQPTKTEAVATPDGEENMEVVCTVDLGGNTGDQDLYSLRDPAAQAEDNKPHIATTEVEPKNADKAEPCAYPSDKKHICPNAWCAMQHRFPCLHKLAMIRYGQYTAANVVGIAQR